MTVINATYLIMENYQVKLNKLLLIEKKKKKIRDIFLMLSMIETALNYKNTDNKITEDKLSRWLGFIQGKMHSNNWLDINDERMFTRPIFHKAYIDMGIQKPETITASLNDIHFNMNSVELFKNEAKLKYNVNDISKLSKKQLLKVFYKSIEKYHFILFKKLKSLKFDYSVQLNEETIEFKFHNLKVK